MSSTPITILEIVFVYFGYNLARNRMVKYNCEPKRTQVAFLLRIVSVQGIYHLVKTVVDVRMGWRSTQCRVVSLLYNGNNLTLSGCGTASEQVV